MIKSSLTPLTVGPILLCLLQILLWTSTAAGRSSKCQRDVQVPPGFKIRSVKVEGRWVPPLSQLKIEGHLVPFLKDRGLDEMANQRFSLDMVSEAQTAIANYLEKLENQSIAKEFGFADGRGRGAASALIADYCLITDEERQLVDLIMKPKYIRVDLYRVGSNTLPVPRSLLPTFYDDVPRPLLAFNPTFGLANDRKQGVAPSLSISTNLVDLPALLSGKSVSADDLRLDLRASGSRSLSDPYYESHASLSLARLEAGQFLENLAIEGGFAAEQKPLGEGTYATNAVEVGGNLRLRPRAGILNCISLSGKYRRSANRLSKFDGTPTLRTSEEAFVGRAFIDGRFAGGFSRLAVWLDVTSPTKINGSYKRLAGTMGYEKEFGSSNRTVGLEVLLAGGRAWGNVPDYALFFGGNSARNFLYETPDAPVMTNFPVGPLIRSFGDAQAGAKIGAKVLGGTSFWNFNLNLAIPVPGLTRPLIPEVNFANSDGTTTTLKDKLKNVTINSTISAIEGTLEDQIIQELIDRGMPPDEAETEGVRLATEKATRIVNKEFKPSIYFIADKANLFALRPLLMLDLGRMGFPGTLPNQLNTRVAAGGGLQLIVVVAKFEAGYVRTVRGNSGDPRGNFVMRLAFQNIF